MDYTPPVPQPPPPPKPEYVLVEDVTGKPPPVRGVQTLKDNKGNEFKVPFLPNPKCKKCYGRGFTGHINLSSHIIGMLLCLKCYPLIDVKKGQHIVPFEKKLEEKETK